MGEGPGVRAGLGGAFVFVKYAPSPHGRGEGGEGGFGWGLCENQTGMCQKNLTKEKKRGLRPPSVGI